MQLNLKNPLVFFDLETTGINISKDRIVEISILKVFPNGMEEVKTRRINPEMPIPSQSTAIHGITDEDVKDCPTFKQIAKSLVEPADLYLWDEPANYLDVFNQDQLIKLLKENKPAMLLVEHDQYFIQQVTRRRIHLKTLTYKKV